MQDRGDPMRVRRITSLPLSFSLGDGLLEQRGDLGLVAAQRSDEQGGVARHTAPASRVAHRIGFR